jgi:hypothetical protein
MLVTFLLIDWEDLETNPSTFSLRFVGVHWWGPLFKF